MEKRRLASACCPVSLAVVELVSIDRDVILGLRLELFGGATRGIRHGKHVFKLLLYRRLWNASTFIDFLLNNCGISSQERDASKRLVSVNYLEVANGRGNIFLWLARSSLNALTYQLLMSARSLVDI